MTDLQCQLSADHTIAKPLVSYIIMWAPAAHTFLTLRIHVCVLIIAFSFQLEISSGTHFFLPTLAREEMGQMRKLDNSDRNLFALCQSSQ